MSQIPKIDIPESRPPEPAAPGFARVEKSAEPSVEARLFEIEAIMREALRGRKETRANKLAFVAAILASAALLSSGVQTYYGWSASVRADHSAHELTASSLNSPGAAAPNEQTAVEPLADSRTEVTIPELAKRAPTLRAGTLQAWWAGEQARQVQRLEALAKRQALAGDRDGAALSTSRADSIRNSIPRLAEFEKPATR